MILVPRTLFERFLFIKIHIHTFEHISRKPWPIPFKFKTNISLCYYLARINSLGKRLHYSWKLQLSCWRGFPSKLSFWGAQEYFYRKFPLIPSKMLERIFAKTLILLVFHLICFKIYNVKCALAVYRSCCLEISHLHLLYKGCIYLLQLETLYLKWLF